MDNLINHNATSPEEEESVEFPWRQITIAVTFAIIMIVGLIGNALVIIIACKKPVAARSSTGIFILNLSLSDLLFLLFCSPFTATVLTMKYWIFGRLLCKLWNFVIQSSMLASIYTLVILSFDRYFKLVRKPSNRLGNKWGIIIVVFIWIVAAGFSSPCLIVFDITQVNNTSKFLCYDSLWTDPARQKPRYLLFVAMVGYVVPLMLLTFTYASIMKATWKVSNIGSSNCVKRSRKQVTVIISVLVLAFGVSWLPHNIFNVWIALAKDKFPWTQFTFRFKVISWCLTSLHTCLNPVVYCLMSRLFRHAAKEVVTECGKGDCSMPGVTYERQIPAHPCHTLSRLSARYKHRPLFYI
ncbi:galanin receptor type 1-like [Apostichopus japonicus]|uniref:galanin receptor type 1-like n=1 Tax=Stichopus japonicus TaxID=307972 RepID=UPI003AB902CF